MPPPFHRQLAIYIGVGIASAVVDIGIMQLFIFAGVHYIISVTAGFTTGLLFNFYLHTKITFESKNSLRSFGRYMSIVIFNYALTLLCVYIAENLFNNTLLGKLVSLPLVAAIGYLLGKHWVFKI